LYKNVFFAQFADVVGYLEWQSSRTACSSIDASLINY